MRKLLLTFTSFYCMTTQVYNDSEVPYFEEHHNFSLTLLFWETAVRKNMERIGVSLWDETDVKVV